MEKIKFTTEDFEDAIKAGIFDKYNNVTANPSQVMRYFEDIVNQIAKEVHKNARYRSIEIIQEIGSSIDVDGAIKEVQNLRF